MAKKQVSPVVLVVDDDPVIGMALSQTLSAHGYRTVTARDGFEALTILQEGQVNIAAAVLDIRMPGIDGFEICDFLRRDRIPVLLITGSPNAVLRLNLQRMSDAVGAETYLTKPLHVGQVLERIEGMVTCR